MFLRRFASLRILAPLAPHAGRTTLAARALATGSSSLPPRAKLEKYSAFQVDSDGSIKEVKLTKALLLVEGQLHMRDLVQLGLDVPFHLRHTNRLPPQVSHRGRAILTLLGPFKAVVLHDKAYLFGMERSSVRSAIHRLKSKLYLRAYAREPSEEEVDQDDAWAAAAGNHHPPYGDKEAEAAGDAPLDFELVVVEHILEELCTSYQRRMQLFTPVVSRLLLGLSHGSETDAMEGLHRLVPIKNGISNFSMVLDESVECLERLLGSDEDLAGLLLSVRHRTEGRNPDLSLHADVEILVEAYHRKLVLIRHQVSQLSQRVQSTQEVVAIRMDVSRNRIIRAELQLTIASVSLAVVTCIAGFLGMNVEIPAWVSGVDPSEVRVGGGPFLVAVGASCFVGGGLGAFALAYTSGALQGRRSKDVEEVVALGRIFEDMSSIEHAIHNQMERHMRIGVGGGGGKGSGDGTGGELSPAELKVLLSADTARPVTDKEVELIYEIFDASGDGKLRKDEVLGVIDEHKIRVAPPRRT